MGSQSQMQTKQSSPQQRRRRSRPNVGRAATARSAVRALAPLVLAATLLAGCSDSLPSLPKFNDLNPFADKPVILPGKRISVIPEINASSDLASADRPIAIAAFSGNESWPQPGGTANNSPGHLALAANVKVAWTADAGTGSSKYGKLTASPVVFGGKVFTLDAAGTVTAFAVSGGSQAWRVSLKPDNEKSAEKGYGGGLALDGDKLFAATGYGTIVALDPATGKKIWDRNIGVPVRTSPTAAEGRVLAVTTEGELVCLSADDGSETWRYRGLNEKASLITNASPAVQNGLAVAPFTSGDVVAVNLATGQAAWTVSLSKSRGMSSMASLNDAGRPVIDNNVVYAVGHAGSMTASSLRDGAKLWSLTVPGIQQPVVSGDSVFVVDTTGRLLAITRRDGKVQWNIKLTGSSVWSGPVLAGGKLWLTSAAGQLVNVDASTGKIDGTQDLGQPIFVAPIVAGSRMFVITDKAKLIALN